MLLLLIHVWPLRLTAAIPFFTNDAAWSDEAGGVVFRDHGMLVATGLPPALHDLLVGGDGLTVEAWLTPATLGQGGPARIVSYSEHLGSRNFTLGQDGADLVFRLRTTATDRNASAPQARVPDVFAAGRPRHVAVAYDFARLRVYVDGALRAALDQPRGAFDTWERGHRLVLGNEASGERPWRGTLARVALYDRALAPEEVRGNFRHDRPADGAVLVHQFTTGIPEALSRPVVYANGSAPEWLSPVARQPADFALSFLLFAVAGGLAAPAVRRRAGTPERTLATAAVLVAVGALALESLQFFVEGRTSSVRDLAAAVAGGTVGACLGSLRRQPAVR